MYKINFKTKLIASIVIATFLIAVSTPTITLAQEYKHYVTVLMHLENDEYLEPYDVAFDSQGNTYIILYDEDVYEYYVVKLNLKGQVLWAKNISEDCAYIYFIAYDEYSNKVFITGEHYFNGHWHEFIAKLNADNGDFEKAILTPCSTNVCHWPQTIVSDGKGNIYVSDEMDYCSGGEWKYGVYILKFDVELDYKWGKGIMENDNIYPEILSWTPFGSPLDVDSQGNVYAGVSLWLETRKFNGRYYSISPLSLMKISSDGTVAKVIAYNSSNPELVASYDDYVHTVRVKDSGEVFFIAGINLHNVTSGSGYSM